MIQKRHLKRCLFDDREWVHLLWLSDHSSDFVVSWFCLYHFSLLQKPGEKISCG